MTFTLFVRDDCAFCDQAMEILAAARAGDFASVFIDHDATLEARYGARVPVLRDVGGSELDWPFTVLSLQVWLAANRA
ncbi:MAG: glutaredoxin family protein [Lysobacterales bacterium]